MNHSEMHVHYMSRPMMVVAAGFKESARLSGRVVSTVLDFLKAIVEKIAHCVRVSFSAISQILCSSKVGETQERIQPQRLPSSQPSETIPFAPYSLTSRYSGDELLIRVSHSDLEYHTLEVFKKLAEDIILYKPSNISVTYRNDDGSDAGGLRRDFITKLFTNLPAVQPTLFEKIGETGLFRAKMSGSRDPAVIAEERLFFTQLGAILNFCLHSSITDGEQNGLLIAPIFEASLYGMPRCFTGEFIHNIYGNIPSDLLNALEGDGLSSECIETHKAYFKKIYEILIVESDEEEKKYFQKFNSYLQNSIPDDLLKELVMAAQAIDDIDPSINLDDPASIRAHLVNVQAIIREEFDRQIDTKLQRYFPAVHSILRGMVAVSQNYQTWEEIHQEDDLCEKLQGTLNKDRILAKLTIPDRHPNKKNLKRWIQEATKEDLQRLLYATTGSKTLGSFGLNVTHEYRSRLTIFHTCFRRLDLPVCSFANFEDFKTSFEESIANSQHGFTIT